MQCLALPCRQTLLVVEGAHVVVDFRQVLGELRFPLGVTIVGGLLLSQLLTLYTTPVVYLYMDRMRLWWEGRHEKGHAGATPQEIAG